MEYTTGSYVIRANKDWTCKHCKGKIKAGTIHFARIVEYGPEKTRSDGQTYREKNYERAHVICAIHSDLKQEEISLIKDKFNI